MYGSPFSPPPDEPRTPKPDYAIPAADVDEVMPEQLEALIEHHRGCDGCEECDRYSRVRALLMRAFRP